MTTLDTLMFPGTEIRSGSQFPAMLIFQPVHLLWPVEAAQATDTAADIFISNGLCQAHTPQPLANQRDRFLQLINDIQNRKDDYAAQLSSLTVAALSTPEASVDDSQQGIVASLLDSQGVTTPPVKKNADVELWQARLVLKIAEILDREEEEVAMQMALLNDDEENLFKTLQGEFAEDEEESLFEELQQLRAGMSRPTTTTIKRRLTAWSRLYQSGPVPDIDIWLTPIPEAADILLEQYQNVTGKIADSIARLPLPAVIGWSREEAVARIRSFQQRNSETLNQIGQAIATGNGEELKALENTWVALVEDSFPKTHHGTATLTVYGLGETPCTTLLGMQTAPAGSLLAVIEQS